MHHLMRTNPARNGDRGTRHWTGPNAAAERASRGPGQQTAPPATPQPPARRHRPDDVLESPFRDSQKVTRPHGTEAAPIRGDAHSPAVMRCFLVQASADTGMRNRVICVGLPKWARMPSMVAGSTVA
jgi:hypothetical protein